MTERHLIGEAIFDVAFASPELARRRQGELAVFFRDRLMPLVEQVLNEFSDTPARIDQLEVDLGNFHEARIERDMPQRFQESLRSALKTATAQGLQAEKTAADNQATRAQQQLRRFLETGLVGRDTDPKMADLIGETLLAVARSDPTGFAEYLQRAPRREAIIRRLAKQFSAKVLMELMRLLSEAYAWPEGAAGGASSASGKTDADWEAALGTIVGRAAQGSAGGTRIGEGKTIPTMGRDAAPPQGSVPQEARADLGEGDWQFARALAEFDAALAQGTRAEIIERWRDLWAGPVVQLRTALRQRLADDELRHRLVTELPEALLLDGVKLLLGASGGVLERLLAQLGGPAEGALRQRLWSDTLDYLQRQGEAAFDTAAYIAAMRAHWRESGAESAEAATLQAALQRIELPAAPAGASSDGSAEAEAAYERITRRLSGQTQQDVTADIVKLAKQHPALLRQLQQQLRRGEASASATQALGVQEARQLVLALLALEGTAAAAEFRREIERQATEAWSEGRYYRHILARLVTVGDVDLQLAAEAPLAAADAEDASPPPPEGMGRYDQLLLRLLRRLRGESGAAEMAAEIEELAAGAPQALKQLYRKLQSGELRLVLAGMTAGECAQLVEAFLQSGRPGEPIELLREVRAHASGCRDLAAYYRQVLQMLIGGKLVDLVAAANAVPEAGADRPESAAVAPTPAVTPRPPEPRSIFSKPTVEPVDEEEPTEEIYVANAGMVLAAPYFPRLFNMLELTEGGKFKDERAMERAIHLLQYAVNGSCDSPEFLLVLNKILCGARAAMPVARHVELAERERQAVEGMLQAVIHNWKIIGKTSVRGLQASFLQRMGRLQLKGDDWYLKVESKGIDVLLDQLPWSISIIRHPWMKRMVFVEWR